MIFITMCCAPLVEPTCRRDNKLQPYLGAAHAEQARSVYSGFYFCRALCVITCHTYSSLTVQSLLLVSLCFSLDLVMNNGDFTYADDHTAGDPSGESTYSDYPSTDQP